LNSSKPLKISSSEKPVDIIKIRAAAIKFAATDPMGNGAGFKMRYSSNPMGIARIITLVSIGMCLRAGKESPISRGRSAWNHKQVKVAMNRGIEMSRNQDIRLKYVSGIDRLSIRMSGTSRSAIRNCAKFLARSHAKLE
jgi:hypothetical protein